MKTFEPLDVTVAALAVFPPGLRIAALESKAFRDRLNVAVDAVIQLNQAGIAFKRSALFNNIRNLLAGSTTGAEIVDTNEEKWALAVDDSRRRIRISRAEKGYWLP